MQAGFGADVSRVSCEQGLGLMQAGFGADASRVRG